MTGSRRQQATSRPSLTARSRGKFSDPRTTADSARRARVDFRALETLWFNTGTLCNIECTNCYIESSPENDSLEYLSADEVARFLDEIELSRYPTQEIAFTGGEPFMNPELPDMLALVLNRGLQALVLTNGMRPMMRAQIQAHLVSLRNKYGKRLQIRVSLDHYSKDLHESERGEGSWDAALSGLSWLAAEGFALSIAGRSRWEESEKQTRAGYAALFRRMYIPCDASDPAQLLLFPEMDLHAEVPEITVDCWRIIGVDPSDMMCASSRMVVKRNGASAPAVVACTLLPYEAGFELGNSLAEALRPVALNHPHCAQFCVLGGGSCSAERAPQA